MIQDSHEFSLTIFHGVDWLWLIDHAWFDRLCTPKKNIESFIVYSCCVVQVHRMVCMSIFFRLSLYSLPVDSQKFYTTINGLTWLKKFFLVTINDNSNLCDMNTLIFINFSSKLFVLITYYWNGIVFNVNRPVIFVELILVKCKVKDLTMRYMKLKGSDLFLSYRIFKVVPYVIYF